MDPPKFQSTGDENRSDTRRAGRSRGACDVLHRGISRACVCSGAEPLREAHTILAQRFGGPTTRGVIIKMQQTDDSKALWKGEGKWGATTLLDTADAAEEGDADAADTADTAAEGFSLKYCTFGDLPYFFFSLSIA